MIDLVGGIIQVETSHDGKVLWINQDGRCVLRICRINSLHINLIHLHKEIQDIKKEFDLT